MGSAQVPCPHRIVCFFEYYRPQAGWQYHTLPLCRSNQRQSVAYFHMQTPVYAGLDQPLHQAALRLSTDDLVVSQLERRIVLSLSCAFSCPLLSLHLSDFVHHGPSCLAIAPTYQLRRPLLLSCCRCFRRRSPYRRFVSRRSPRSAFRTLGSLAQPATHYRLRSWPVGHGIFRRRSRLVAFPSRRFHSRRPCPSAWPWGRRCSPRAVRRPRCPACRFDLADPCCPSAVTSSRAS
ncbi:hypothetical protein PF003_g4078 [Phytophthora fragariae]|nr:hypothetical protein PF003_g4078 [Phytophthora fragariae]